MDNASLENHLETLMQRAEAARSDGLLQQAAQACQEALELLEDNPETDADHRSTQFRLLLGDIYWTADDLEEALRQYDHAAATDPDSLDAEAAAGIALFHLCRFSAARTKLELLSAQEPDMGDVWYYLGLLAQRGGETGLCSYAFHKANQIDPEQFPLPLEVSRDEVEEMVSAIIDQLPEPLHEALANVPILLEDLPGDEILFDSDPPLDPLLLGLFLGIPLTEQSVFQQPGDVTRILLFQKNIERIAGDRATLERELWITLKHEIGHFWGLSEEQLAEMGLE